ncbi:hypothetical protein [Companilactobacillus zhongbaensis]|uniref:hypothetical protein n=1 Tax=Companilactobacillus zhongbaensis TaxID=2486009 RepID=UPI000F79B4FB|nr:hypothetical protein [Companilactobacillus zhongbaensis]
MQYYSSQTQSSKDSQSKSSQTKSETKYYQNLSNADKKKVTFSFKQDRDETAEDYADPVFVMSMTVKNKSDKTIKFDKSKFIFIHDKTYKINSDQTGTLTVKPGKTKVVNQLFENVPEQALVGIDGKVVYLNSQNKLKDIKPSGLQSHDDSSDNDKAVDSQTQGTSSADLSKNNTDDNTNNRRIKSADMAKSLFIHAMAVDPSLKSDVEAVETDDGYELTYHGISTLITFNGDEVTPDGDVAPFAQLAGPTHRSSGWVYN